MPRVLQTQKICEACRLHFYGETLTDIAIYLDVNRCTLTYWRKTQIRKHTHRKTFMSEFKDMMYSIASKDHIELDWFHEGREPEGKYKVDCRINGMRMPLFVYALSTDRKVNQATIAL
ncbi:hypothetical protein F4054_16840 [Candidatus Poribacteria bacterium]|nr:hypothetical protein [Candidatus Poribacteria bacterium]MYK23910.1 hypothetical protein [Candidatus Poribacteria bacterium]